MSERSKDTGVRHNIFERADEARRNAERLNEKISFSEYIDKVVENPSIVRTSHQTVYNALTSREDFFVTGKNALFGAEETIENFTTILKGGAEGLEIGKRIILLVGPPGSGKSTLVNGTKRGIEEYSKTDEGAMYAIEGCPMNEDPLHLIPNDMREGLLEEFGIKIEGDLCPHCSETYKDVLEGDDGTEALKNIPVNRLVLSEKDRVGIGTFKPSDPKSQDITELVGSVNISGLSEFGVASNAKAYSFDGELNVANRGVMEFVEMLKSDEKFLYSLLDLAQDRVIKAPRFSNISADEVILAHTNLTEYYRYVNDPKNEALRDRMVVIPVPYALRVSDEEKIHKKLIGESEQVRKAKVHINPRTLETAAQFAVLSRIQPSNKMSKLQKMKVYNGELVDGVSARDIKELHSEARHNSKDGRNEGMVGISPRYIIDSLSLALSKQGDKKCITPMDAIRALSDNLDKHPHTRDMKGDDRKALEEDLKTIRDLFVTEATDEVRRAFIGAFDDQAESLFANYINNVQAYLTNDKLFNETTQQEVEPDEQLMRSIEEQIGIHDNGKKEFRSLLSHKFLAAAVNKQEFDYHSDPRLETAIKKKLFADLKDVIKLATGSQVQSEKSKKRVREVEQTLVEEYGYCEHCAGDVVRFVSENMNQS